MKNILVFLAVLTVPLSLQAAGLTAEQQAILQSLAEQPLEKPVQIDYELVEFTESTPEKIAKDVREYRRLLGPTNIPESQDERVQAFRKTLSSREGQKSEGLFVMGPDFLANRLLRKVGGRLVAFWDMRRGPDRYNLTEGELLAIVPDPKIQTHEYQDLARESIGRLGKIDLATLEELRKGPVQVSEDGGKTVLRKGKLSVAWEKKDGRECLFSIERVEPEVAQRQAVIFEDYRTLAGVNIPCRVTYIFENRDGRSRRVYSIQNLKFGDDYAVPVMNRSFGLIRVADFRFPPKISYLADGYLPIDAQIAEWKSDPAALKRHNDEVSSSRARPRFSSPGGDSP